MERWIRCTLTNGNEATINVTSARVIKPWGNEPITVVSWDKEHSVSVDIPIQAFLTLAGIEFVDMSKDE